MSETAVRAQLQELCKQIKEDQDAVMRTGPFVIHNPRLVINVQTLRLDRATLEQLLQLAGGD